MRFRGPFLGQGNGDIFGVAKIEKNNQIFFLYCYFFYFFFANSRCWIESLYMYMKHMKKNESTPPPTLQRLEPPTLTITYCIG